MGINFNEISKDTGETTGTDRPRNADEEMKRAISSGERTRFICKPNAMVERDYEIYEYDYKKSKYVKAGDYVLLNKKELRGITEKKVKNLMSIMNKKDDIIDISNLTKSRVLYTIVPEAQAGDQTKIVFRDYDGSGVSKDNAIFTIRKGVLYDKWTVH